MTSLVTAKYDSNKNQILDPNTNTGFAQLATDPLTGKVVGFADMNGNNAFSFVGGLLTGVGNASANTTILQSALTAGGTVKVDTPGIYYSNSFKIPSGVTLSLSAGVVLKRADNVNAPLIRNQYAGQMNKGTRFNRASNVVTVNNKAHGWSVGQQIWVGQLTDSTMNGIQTVATVPDADTWTYASTGSNGAGGAATNFGAIIPIKRTIPGASFSSASNVVTVTDPGHDLRPGFNVWLGTTGASTAFAGMVEVIAVWPGFWQYVTTASGTATATGTFAINYDRDISITGDGMIDGNALNNSSVQDVDLMLSLMHFGTLNQSKFDVKRSGGTIFRIWNFFNSADISMMNMEWGDTLVGVEFEGSAKRITVKNIRGSDGKQVSGAQQADDFVAFTGTAMIGGQLYDSTVSPYGLGDFKNIKVSEMFAPNCLNGVKLTANPACTIDEFTCEDIVGGMLNNNQTPLGAGTSGVRMTDDGAGQIGMVCGNIYIKRVNWFGGAAAVLWASTGSAKLLDIDGVNYAPNAQQSQANTVGALYIQGGSTGSMGKIGTLRVRNLVAVSQFNSLACVTLGNGMVKATQTLTIDEFDIEGYDITAGGATFVSGSGILKWANCTIGSARVGKGIFRGPSSGTANAIGCLGPDNMGRWTLDGARIVPGTAAMSYAFIVGVADQTVCSGEVVFRGCDINTISGVYDNNSNWSGNLKIRISDTKAPVSGVFINAAVATALIELHASPTTTITTDAVAGTLAGTLRVNGPSVKLVGSKVTAPQPGDMFWSTDTSTTGSASIGMKARTNAGAWAALF